MQFVTFSSQMLVSYILSSAYIMYIMIHYVEVIHSTYVGYITKVPMFQLFELVKYILYYFHWHKTKSLGQSCFIALHTQWACICNFRFRPLICLGLIGARKYGEKKNQQMHPQQICTMKHNEEKPSADITTRLSYDFYTLPDEQRTCRYG